LDNFEICNTSFVRDNIGSLLKKLTNNEKKLYENYLQEEKKYEFLGGRVLVKQCLLKTINRDKDIDFGFLDIDIKREKTGTPGLFVGHKKLNNVHFSISHKKDYIFCAADPECVIGVDVEKVDNKLEKLKKYFMSPEEESVIEDRVERKEMLFQYYTGLWASKECVVKCLKKNLWEIFKKVRLTGLVDNAFLLKYMSDTEERDISSSNFLYDGYVFSVVSLSKKL
jgi:phosphopantetheinyl transferase (holo-ACP synthase)